MKVSLCFAVISFPTSSAANACGTAVSVPRAREMDEMTEMTRLRDFGALEPPLVSTVDHSPTRLFFMDRVESFESRLFNIIPGFSQRI